MTDAVTSQVTNPDNVLANPPASGTVQDSGIQQAVNASDPAPNESTPPVVDGQGTPPADTNADGTKKTPWFQRRIDQLTAEKWEERREKESLRKQTADLLAQLSEVRRTGVVTQTQQPTAVPPVQPQVDPATGQPITPAPVVPQNVQPVQPVRPVVTEAEINAIAERKAQEMAKTAAFTKACNDVYSNGKDDFQDFDQSLRTFQMLGGIPQPLLEIVTEMPNAHKVLYKIGKDLDLAEKIVKMTPMRMAMELARVESAVTKPTTPVISAAPRPLTPVDGGARSDKDPENMSTEEWIKWRESQLASRRK